MIRNRHSFKRYFPLFLVVLLLGSLVYYLRTQFGESPFPKAGGTVLVGSYYVQHPVENPSGGIMIYPNAGEDPAIYAHLATELANAGLLVRVARYPLGQPAFSRVGKDEIPEEEPDIPWIAMGFGKGLDRAVRLADRSSQVRGLIILGKGSTKLYLNDNDVRVTYFQLKEEALDAEELAELETRMPADMKIRTARSAEALVSAFPDEGISLMASRPDDLVTEVLTLLSSEVARE